MATAPATTRLPNTQGYVYDDQDSYTRFEDTEAREMVSDAYSESKTYSKSDIVINDNILYEAKQDIATPETFNLEHWKPTNLATIAKAMQADISALNSKIIVDGGIHINATAIKKNTFLDIPITFSQKFNGDPIVSISLYTISSHVDYAMITPAVVQDSISKTGFTVRIFVGNIQANERVPALIWLAVEK